MRTSKHFAILLACLGLLAPMVGLAQSLPRDYYDDMLDSFSFNDNTNWMDDCEDMPLTWTNLAVVSGDGQAVLMDNTNGSWLQYPILVNGYTNLSLTQGTVMFWVFLTNSASSNSWNLDPGQWGTFLEAGSFTTNASYGWWSLYTDGSNILFSAQDNLGSETNYLRAPLNWCPQSNAWTHLALTYSSNASQLFLNGSLQATGPGLSVVPDLGVISNSFYLGSSGASNQLHAAFDDVWIYDCPLDAGTIAGDYGVWSIIYSGNPVLVPAPASSFVSAQSQPTYTPTFNAVTGPGYLTPVSTNTTSCVTSANVWITNVVARVATNGTMSVTLTISGGSDGLMYDVFANSVLDFSSNTNLAWAWMGQGSHCVTYVLTNLPNKAVFLVLGKPDNEDNDGLTTAYEKLVSKTDPQVSDSACSGIPDWWIWLYLGSRSESPTNLDSQGVNSLLYDYTNGLDPNVISFTVSATNRYVNQSAVPLQIALQAGRPGSYAVLINDSNPANAQWLSYPGTNITANLPSTDGVYSVSVGLRGLPQFAQQTWQTVQLTKDTVGPMVVITSPAVNVTSQPTIQLQGYTTKPLSAVTYDLSNAVGVVTGQTGSVTAEYLDPAQCVFTTNWLQCYDIDLTNGANTITLRVTDWAGNTSTTNVSITLDYSVATNPVVQVLWPQDGSQVCAGVFTCRGTLDDPTATVTAQISDTNGDVNVVSGVVGRNGIFWLENLPLNSGPNTLAIAVTNAAGMGTVTNMTLTQGTLTLTMNPVQADQLWQPTLSVTGTVSDASCTLSVNGVAGVNNGDGTWYALNVPSSAGGVAAFDLAASSGGNRLLSNTNTDKPSQIVVTNYMSDWTNVFTPASGGGHGPEPKLTLMPGIEEYHLVWLEDIGSAAYDTVTLSGESCTTYYVWPADEYILGVRSPSSNGVVTYSCWTDVGQTGPPSFNLEHCNVATNGVSSGGTNSYSRKAQASLTLLTGGIGPLHQQRLFQISGSVFAITNLTTLGGYSLLPSQIKMGELGSLGTDGNLWCVLQENERKTITPTVLGTRTPDYYTFTAGQTSYLLGIVANGIALSNGVVAAGANFCVGQEVWFAVSALPGGVGATNFHWTFGGTYFNNYSNAVPGGSYPTYSEVKLVDAGRLTNNPSGVVWVSGGAGENSDPNKPAVYPASLSCTLLFTNGTSSKKLDLGGLFKMFRPRAKITPWTKSVNVFKVRGVTSLIFADPAGGDGITFSNIVVCPTNFPGSTDWVQVDFSPSATARGSDLVNHFEVENGPGPYLDKTCPYSSFDSSGNPVDSPGFALDSLTSGYIRASQSDSFEMCMFFCPGPGQHWVPLRAVKWSWSGSATNGPSGWGLEAGTNSINPIDFDTQTLESYPQWKSNVTNTQWVPLL